LILYCGSDSIAVEKDPQTYPAPGEGGLREQLKEGRVILMPDMREDAEFKRRKIEQKNFKHNAVGRSFSLIDKLNEGFKKKNRVFLKIDPSKMPSEARVSLDNILSIQGVKIEIPGNYLGAAYMSGKCPDRSIETGDDIYTLDDISLIKDREGEFYLSGKPSYMEHLRNKSLVLKRDAEKELGDVTFLSSALVKWAVLDVCGYRLDKRSRKILKRSVGEIYKGNDPSKRIREFESSLYISSGKGPGVRGKIRRFIFDSER
jgi:hypothetical protein